MVEIDGRGPDQFSDRPRQSALAGRAVSDNDGSLQLRPMYEFFRAIAAYLYSVHEFGR
jgi:hypothetical protein